MKIAIYGDSFGKSMIENLTSDNIDRGKSWAELLEEKYEVANFARPGSSLFYSYKLFLENNQNFDYNIFLVTEPNRITLPDEFDIHPLSKHVNLSLIYTYKDQYSSKITNDFKLDIVLSALESYYSVVHNQQAIDIFHNLMLENIIRINQNTIIIPCFNRSIPNTEVSLSSVSSYEYMESVIHNKLADNCYHIWKAIDDENGKWTYSDYRKCHLNEENSKILYSIIEDAINNKQQTINLNLNQFSKMPKDIEYYFMYIDLTIGPKHNNPRRLNGELHNLYNKLLIDTN